MGTKVNRRFLRIPRTLTTPSRTLNSASFQVDTNFATFVSYSIRIQDTVTVTGGSQGMVQLLVSSTSPATESRSRGRNGLTGTVIIGVAVNGDGTYSVSSWVPAGWYVKISTSNVSGTPTITLEDQTETVH